ncbi:M20 family metallo-hydrolase [Staphylococcus simiae]|uniref:M20 family metallo-hydrolase n=1 Tax=Staphylococcus simiae TaxID=308354 RepID=UPI001A9845B2|nr:M20 family metallo-hydrolase [Staphylococcus simiae]MBO1198745.1 M20 family metallo-hydrolase [Staphylococcus simiae]MBO1200997.1 M20 family metallo-hydrolase [Staphylococcus simiae]MBO1203158.1 M20 family metallo-hydrolase [Staphylococcus simiae]MBO1210734.1 M20 family metallo-hydrolase [Staphylococcus simiae]MBO1229335.1 M20 family metallo-hydrolase [Staphylococcus simiae]
MNINNVLNHLATFNELGYNPDNGGINRIAFSHPERMAALKFSMLCQRAGLDVYFDFIGNVIARREGKYPDLKPVVIGSHIDTVKDGGQYDGLLGVIGALEVVEYLNKHQIETDHPLIIIAFACEESARFNEATIGSKYLTGQYNRASLKDIVDNDGYVLYDIVQPLSQEVRGQTALFERNQIKAFLELHIEQGPILENNNDDIGIVTHIAAPHRFKVTVQGVTSHSGSTPMPMRTDALTSASEMILNIEQLAQQYTNEGIVATVGYVDVYPNTMNSIPGEVSFLIDIRGKDEVIREEVVQHILNSIDQISTQRHTHVNITDLGNEHPAKLNAEMAKITENVCKQHDFEYRYMYSGAGHDAMNFASIVPTSMIFIPCKDGISHSPLESVTSDQIAKGVQTLIDTTLELTHKTTTLEDLDNHVI